MTGKFSLDPVVGDPLGMTLVAFFGVVDLLTTKVCSPRAARTRLTGDP